MTPSTSHLLHSVRNTTNIVNSTRLYFEQRVRSTGSASIRLTIYNKMRRPLVRLPFIPRHRNMRHTVTATTVRTSTLTKVTRLRQAHIRHHSNTTNMIPHRRTGTTNLAVRNSSRHTQTILANISNVSLATKGHHSALAVRPMRLRTTRLNISNSSTLNKVNQITRRNRNINTTLDN